MTRLAGPFSVARAAAVLAGLAVALPSIAWADEGAPGDTAEPAPAAAAEPAPAAEPEVAAEPEPEPEKDKPSIRVIQQRPFLHSVRFELQLFGGVGVADTMYDHYLAVASGRLHVTEEWSVGGGYSHYFAGNSNLFTDVTDRFELFPEQSLIKFFAGIDVAWAPIYGKLTLFDEVIFHYDLYLLAGGGVTQTTRSTNLKFTPLIGLGARLITTRWLALTFELRDHMYVEAFNAGDEFVNNVVFMGGLSIFFPFDFEYVYAR